MFANGIPPDVTGDRFEGIGGPEHIIVVTLFPENAAGRFSQRVGSVLFEKPDKFTEVRLGECAFREKMKMVRHDTERVEKEAET